jgi:hypothetical protein
LCLSRRWRRLRLGGTKVGTLDDQRTVRVDRDALGPVWIRGLTALDKGDALAHVRREVVGNDQALPTAGPVVGGKVLSVDRLD